MRTILIIEDNSDTRENICELLELKGYSVLSAVNGREGLDLAKAAKPDLILCDILMPEMDGYNVLIRLKDDIDTMYIPFCFLTCSAEKRDVEIGLGVGADGYISKPFAEEELMGNVERCLKANKMMINEN